MLLQGHAFAPRCLHAQQQRSSLRGLRPTQVLRTRRRALQPSCSATSGNGRGGEFSDKGNLDVQDELVDQIQIGIAKAKVKEDLLKDLEQRKDGLRKIGDELTDQLEKRLELDKARMNMAGNASLADTLEEFRQLDEDVQRIRDELQADRRDLVAFEKRKAEERSKGLFFKRLYTVKDEEGEGGSSTKSSPASDAEAAEKRRLTMERVKEPAKQELRSPARLGLFAYLTIVLAWVVGEDISLGDPDLRRDALYGVLCLILGINTWNERQTLVQEREAVSQMKEQEEKQQQQQQQQEQEQEGEDKAGGSEKQ